MFILTKVKSNENKKKFKELFSFFAELTLPNILSSGF